MARCSGFGWHRLNVLYSSWDGLCFSCVTKTLLITQECFCYCWLKPKAFLLLTLPHKRWGWEWGHSWDNWPWLAQGTSHTIWGHAHQTNLWPNVPNFAHDSFALATFGAANWFHGHFKWSELQKRHGREVERVKLCTSPDLQLWSQCPLQQKVKRWRSISTLLSPRSEDRRITFYYSWKRYRKGLLPLILPCFTFWLQWWTAECKWWGLSQWSRFCMM